jgi:acetate kinase
VVGYEALEVLRLLSHLAPLHNPVNLQGIEAAQLLLPDAVHCAIFDTAWHQTMPPRAYRYAVPASWHDDLGVRRYGFHGSSFLYVARRCAALLGRPAAETNLVLFHVGHGASANAVAGGVSVDTSMGMTPLEGLVMGTRCGDLDPAVPFHVMQAMDRPPEEIERALQRKSGVLGLAGVADRREVEQRAHDGDERAVLALDVEGYRLRKYLGAYAAALGRLDAVAFTGGAGEMSPTLRGRALRGLGILGIELDEDRNRLSRTHHGETCITAPDSPVPVFVVPTDEERVMAEDTIALVEGRYDLPANFRYSFEEPDFVDEERCTALQAELSAHPAVADILVSC